VEVVLVVHNTMATKAEVAEVELVVFQLEQQQLLSRLIQSL